MILKNIINELNIISPLQNAEEWDNVGLLVESKKSHNIKKILLTIDLTNIILDEAVNGNYDLIITYHPILFLPIQKIKLSNPDNFLITRIIKSNISIYSPHTALDNMNGGINDWLIKSVGEGKIIKNNSNSVRLIKLSKPITFNLLIKNIKEYLGLKYLRIAEASNKKISTIACCAGSGYQSLKDIDADCYLTGEMSHHNILSTKKNGINVILSEHSHTERGYLKLYKKSIKNRLPKNIIVDISKKDKEPIKIK